MTKLEEKLGELENDAAIMIQNSYGIAEARLTRDAYVELADQIKGLISAIRRLREQRDANYDGPMPNTTAERDDAEILKILMDGRDG